MCYNNMAAETERNENRGIHVDAMLRSFVGEANSLTDVTHEVGKALGCEKLELSDSYEDDMKASFGDDYDEKPDDEFSDEMSESDLYDEEFALEERDWESEQKRNYYITDGRKERARRHGEAPKFHEKKIISKVRAEGMYRGYGRQVHDGKKTAYYGYNVIEKGRVFTQYRTQVEAMHLRPSRTIHRKKDKLRAETDAELLSMHEPLENTVSATNEPYFHEAETEFYSSEAKFKPSWMSGPTESIAHIDSEYFIWKFPISLAKLRLYWKEGLLTYDPLNNIILFRYDEDRNDIAKEGKLFICRGITL